MIKDNKGKFKVIYFGMEPNPALSAKMVMTEFELRTIKRAIKPVQNEVKKIRKPSGKGYTINKLADGTSVFKAQVQVGDKVYPLGRYETPEQARALYIEAIDQINNGDFVEWHKRFKLNPYKKHKESYK